MLPFSTGDGEALLLSLRVSLVAVAIITVPGVLLGHWLARSHSRWRPIVEAIVVVPLVLPPVVTGFGLLAIASRLGLAAGASWWAPVLASAVVAAPLLVRTIRASVETVDPRLATVAATLGASRERIFATVTLPMIRPAVVGGLALAWARAFGEFGATIVVAGNTPGITRTLPLAMYTDWIASNRSPWPLALLAIAVSLVAVLLAEWMIHRTRKRSVHAPVQAVQVV